MKQINTRRGFTLIELLIVILIIVILAAIALPQYQKAVEKARVKKMIALFHDIRQAQHLYYLEHGTYADSMNQLPFNLDLPKITKSRNQLLPEARWGGGVQVVDGLYDNGYFEFGLGFNSEKNYIIPTFVVAVRKGKNSALIQKITDIPNLVDAKQPSDDVYCYDTTESNTWCKHLGSSLSQVYVSRTAYFPAVVIKP